MLAHVVGMAAQTLDDGEFASGAICQGARDIEAKIDVALETSIKHREAQKAVEEHAAKQAADVSIKEATGSK